MTTIQNTQTPGISVSVNTPAIRKAALVGLTLAGTAVLAAATIALVVFASLNVTAATYGFVLLSVIVTMSALGIRENANQAKKTQYDIR